MALAFTAPLVVLCCTSDPLHGGPDERLPRPLMLTLHGYRRRFCCGIIYDKLGRPVPVGQGGNAIEEILA